MRITPLIFSLWHLGYIRQQKDIFILIVGLLESAKMAKHKNLSEFDRDESVTDSEHLQNCSYSCVDRTVRENFHPFFVFPLSVTLKFYVMKQIII